MKIVTIANLYRNKGLDIAIEAVQDLPVEYHIIGGDGDDSERIKKLAAQTSNVKLLGYIPDAYMRLNEYDIYLQPSTKEGSPYAILEAMRAGMPIVATNTGSVPEMLKECGIIVDYAEFNPCYRHEVLKKGIERLINNPHLRDIYGQRAKERQQQFYDKDKMLSDMRLLEAQLIKKYGRMVNIQVNHGLPYKEEVSWWKKLLYKKLLQSAFKKADAIICLSEMSREEMIRDKMASEHKIYVIPNGI